MLHSHSLRAAHSLGMDPRLACRHSSSHGDPEKEKRIEIELLGSTVTSFLCLHFDSAKLK